MFESKPNSTRKSEAIMHAESAMRRLPGLFDKVAKHYNSTDEYGVFEEVIMSEHGGIGTGKSFGYVLIVKPGEATQLAHTMPENSFRHFIIVRDGMEYGIGIESSYYTGLEVAERNAKGENLNTPDYIYLSNNDAGLQLNGVPVDLAADLDALDPDQTTIMQDIESFVKFASVATFSAQS